MKKSKTVTFENFEQSQINDLFGFSDITKEQEFSSYGETCVKQYTPGNRDDCLSGGVPKDPPPPLPTPTPVNGGYGCDPGPLGTGPRPGSNMGPSGSSGSSGGGSK